MSQLIRLAVVAGVDVFVVLVVVAVVAVRVCHRFRCLNSWPSSRWGGDTPSIGLLVSPFQPHATHLRMS